MELIPAPYFPATAKTGASLLSPLPPFRQCNSHPFSEYVFPFLVTARPISSLFPYFYSPPYHRQDAVPFSFCHPRDFLVSCRPPHLMTSALLPILSFLAAPIPFLFSSSPFLFLSFPLDLLQTRCSNQRVGTSPFFLLLVDFPRMHRVIPPAPFWHTMRAKSRPPLLPLRFLIGDSLHPHSKSQYRCFFFFLGTWLSQIFTVDLPSQSFS